MAFITISGQPLSNWQGDADVELRIYPLEPFIASDNQPVQGGPFNEDSPSNDLWYVRVPLTVSGGSVGVPTVSLYSTDDAQENPGAAYLAAFFTTEGRFITYFAGFKRFSVPHAPSPTTWAAIAEANEQGNL